MRIGIIALAALLLSACNDSPVGVYVYPDTGRETDLRENGYVYFDGRMGGKWSLDQGMVTMVGLEGDYMGTYEVHPDRIESQDVLHIVLYRQ